jgi:salicylate hydroxylase
VAWQLSLNRQKFNNKIIIKMDRKTQEMNSADTNNNSYSSSNISNTHLQLPSMPSRTKPTFNVIICGGGLGGLGAAISLCRKGHSVTVVEAASQLNEVGAGIQIPPNSTRILEAYGLTSKFLKKVVWPQHIHFRRYETGEVIGSTKLHPRMTDTYGYPYWLIHRADYQRLLYDAAIEAGAKIMLATPINFVDPEAPAVVLKDGRRFEADLIVGADGESTILYSSAPLLTLALGIRSRTRRAVIPDKLVEANDSANCAFRATVSAEVMNSIPEVAHLMTDINANCWIGHQRHCMAYPIRQGAMYNLVLSHPGKATPGKWNEPGDLNDMKQQYSKFDPIVQRVLQEVKSCLKWKLADLPPLSNWVSESGKVVLIGDAAHAMVPYLAQVSTNISARQILC